MGGIVASAIFALLRLGYSSPESSLRALIDFADRSDPLRVMTTSNLIDHADNLRQAGQYDLAIDAYMQAIQSQEKAAADICLKLARCHLKMGDHAASCAWLCRVVDGGEAFLPWQAAASLLEQILAQYTPPAKRRVRVAVLGSYTTAQWTSMLRLAALREGISLDLYEGQFGQYRQEIMDPTSGLYSFGPELVILAIHAGETSLPLFSQHPRDEIEKELSRWRFLWKTFADRCTARLVMHNFAVPALGAIGHLSTRMAGAHQTMMNQLNMKLGEAAGSNVSIVDCDRLSALFGKRRWFDDKYWHLSKQAVALDALPLLARHTIAVLAADLGLSKKCLLLDLDNTLWGGVIGEDGLAGIQLGAGSPEGEAFVAFQQYILDLKSKGVILVVCSKNNPADAREPFEKHPDMRLRLDDFAMFITNWKSKPDNIRMIAQTLNIGLDSMVFVDDNPAEREKVRQFLPEVEVITLPESPMEYARTLSEYLGFETSALTADDADKTRKYQARAQIAQLQSSGGSIEEFYRSLQMCAVVAPFDEMHLPRIVQLIGKTNQFNLTTRRHSMQSVRQFMADPECVHLYLKLRDRFADHGLVSLIIARREGEVMDIDTWLMSCRVIGRTVEAELLARLCVAAQRMGCSTIRGTYIPTAKNEMVRDVYERFGFRPEHSGSEGATVWSYDLVKCGAIVNGFIEVMTEDRRSAIDAA